MALLYTVWDEQVHVVVVPTIFPAEEQAVQAVLSAGAVHLSHRGSQARQAPLEKAVPAAHSHVNGAELPDLTKPEIELEQSPHWELSEEAEQPLHLASQGRQEAPEGTVTVAHEQVVKAPQVADTMLGLETQLIHLELLKVSPHSPLLQNG